MIYMRSVLFLVCYTMFQVVLSKQIVKKNTNGAIGFPENEENLLKVNKQNRSPVFIPSICPENQLFYPGDQADDWICDCRPGYLYLPKTDKFWPAYERGPCRINEYLVMGNQSAIPICVENPCKKDAMVVWKGKCQAIGTSCGEIFPVAVLWIDAVTINIDCIKVNDVGSRFFEDFKIKCSAGSRRNIENKCKNIAT